MWEILLLYLNFPLATLRKLRYAFLLDDPNMDRSPHKVGTDFCSSQGPRLDAQHPWDGLQQSVAPVLGVLSLSSGFADTDIHAGKNINIHEINNNF